MTSPGSEVRYTLVADEKLIASARGITVDEVRERWGAIETREEDDYAEHRGSFETRS